MAKKQFICIICPTGCKINVDFGDAGTIELIEGNRCKRGSQYVRDEMTDPKRTLTTVIGVRNGETAMCSVRTNKPVAKDLVLEMVKNVAKLEADAPLQVGQVIVKNIMGTGADIVVTRAVPVKS